MHAGSIGTSKGLHMWNKPPGILESYKNVVANFVYTTLPRHYIGVKSNTTLHTYRVV